MINKFNAFRKFSINFIYLFSFVVLGLFLITSILVTAQMPEREFMNYRIFDLVWILFIALQIAVIYILLKYSSKIDEIYFFIFLAGISIIFGLYIIYTINPTLRADAAIVKKAALGFDSGDYTYFQKGKYFDYYPHQLGLLHYERIIMSILGSSSRVLFAINLIQVIMINYGLYLIVNLFGNGNHKMNLLSIYLGFSFLPQFYFIPFAYGLIAGLFFAIYGIYYLLRYSKTKSIIDVIISVVFFVIASTIRSNYTIIVLTAIIYMLIIKFKSYKKASFIFIVLFFTFSRLISYGINSYTENKTGVPISEGAPKELWIVMGTDIDNWYLSPGWYNGSLTETIEDVNYDYKVAQKIARTRIIENIKNIITNPGDSFVFFTGKVVSTWQEPSFQSFWTGPQENYEQENDNLIVKSLYNQGVLYWITFYFMKANLVLIYASVVFYLLRYRNSDYAIFLLYFLGGFIFHLFWETKAQYVYPYIYLLLPITIDTIIKINNLEKRNENERYINSTN